MKAHQSSKLKRLLQSAEGREAIRQALLKKHGLPITVRSRPPQNKKYRSDIAAAVHESIKDLHEIGLVDDETMRHFDRVCLTEEEL